MKARTKRMLASFLAFIMAFTLLPLSLFNGALEVKGAETSGHVMLTDGLKAGETYGNADVVKITVLEDMAYKSGEVTIDGVDYGGYVQGSKNPSPSPKTEAPTAGAVVVMEAVQDCSVSFVLNSAKNDGKVWYFYKGTELVSSETVATGSVKFDLEAGSSYSFSLAGSKTCIYDIAYKAAAQPAAPAATISGHVDLADGLKAGETYGDADAVKVSVMEDMPYKKGEVNIDGVDYAGYVQGSKNPSPSPKTEAPTAGAVVVMEAVKDCSVSFVLNSAKNDGKVWYLYKGTELVSSETVATGSVKFDLEAGATYTFSLAGSKTCIYDIAYKAEGEAGAGDDYVKTSVDLSAGLLAAQEYGDAAAKITVMEDMPYKSGEVTIDGTTYAGYVQGSKNPSPSPKTEAPTAGAVVVMEAAKNCSVSFVLNSAKNDGKVWYLYKGTELVSSETVATGSVKFDLEAGAAYTFSLAGSKTCIYAITVESGTAGGSWDSVAAPVLAAPVVNGTDVELTFTGVVGSNGADKAQIVVTDADGKELTKLVSAKEGESNTLKYVPSASGSYKFTVALLKDGEDDKVGNTVSVDFILPMAKPVISAAASAGAGKVSAIWGKVAEAESYEVYVDGKLAGTTTELKYTAGGLTVGTKCSITVVAVRGNDKSEPSAAVEVDVTAKEQGLWGFTEYGSSTSASKCSYKGSANDGSVTVWSTGNGGKVVPNSTDGLSFYYTAVPVEYNFTLRANVHVDSWTFSNGQEGFGLLATDRLGPNGVASAVWNNSYMALISKVEYYYNDDLGANTVSGSKYSMKCGVGVIEKYGVNKDNIEKFNVNDTETVQNEFHTSTLTLEASAAESNLDAGTYNIIGNATAPVDGTIAELTDFVLEIQKNNTGYFVTYYAQDGTELKKIKYYDPAILNQIDSDNVYVGFFASRNATATFTDIQFSTILASEDAPAEERPITFIEPSVNITSSKIANTENYTFVMVPNVAGYVRLVCNNEVLADQAYVPAQEKFIADAKLPGGRQSEFFMEFFPDAEQELEPYTMLANTDKIEKLFAVNRSNVFDGRTNIYVAPNGSENGSGSESSPVDIYTAVKYAQPGQTILLKGGVYALEETVTIARGVNGTADAMIRMIADPNATERPVFDFQGLCTGMVFGGDYWYFQGFDCTRSLNGQKGIQVSGSHNVVDGCNMYHNGNTGLQISRMYSTDLFEDWPSYNLILNCTSYGNADAGYEDADGFAAKLTVGNGNVFDGCVAYNNADDGWDLFAKVETGSIGSVTIKNSVAYGNGYLEDGTNAGNGNGFKMGGDSMSGYHKLINSYAFFNKAKGIDSNSCPDIQVENSISYNNESYNVAFYTNNAANTDFGATGIISFKDETIKKGLTTAEQHKPVGKQDTSKYLGDSNYYWNGSKSVNASGVEVTADWFKTLTFTGITRNADGTINMNGFLELTGAGAASGSGAVPGGTASSDVVVAPETKVDSDDDSSSGSAVGGGAAAAAPETVATESTNYDNYVPVSVFADLMANGKTLVVETKDDAGNVVATYTIDGKAFTAVPASDFELKVQENVTNNGVADVVKASLNVDASKIDIVSFTHHGVLNGTISVKLNLMSKKYGAGTVLKLYYFNENTRTLEDTKQTVSVAADNTVTFTIDHCSYYVLVPAEAVGATTEPTPAAPAESVKTADTNPIALLMVFALLSGVAFLAVSKKRIME